LRTKKQNAFLARDVTKYRELAQYKEMRIREPETEHFKLRKYVVTFEELAYSQKEHIERKISFFFEKIFGKNFG
jgi:hypothetical protein